MRKPLKFLIFAFIAGTVIYFLPLLYLKLRVQPTEIYPEVANLVSIDNKKALIIVAHHDDMFGCVAFTKWLCDNNWDVRAFYFRSPPYRRDTIREQNGILSTSKVSEIIGLKEFNLIDQSLRKDTIIDDLNIPYEEFKNVFEIDTITRVISDLIAVLEPTIMCLGDSVCMQFRLVSTTGEEDQIWVGDYREDKRQILNLFNRLTRQVADEVMIELTPEEERLLAKSRTVDREAYDAYLKARYYVNDFSKESLFKALDYLNSAIEKEPDWAPLYGGLAELWMNIQLGGYESPSVAAPKISENLNKAMELDPDLALVHYLSAMNAHWVEWNWEKSEKEFLKALAINPNDSWARLLYSQLLLILQRNDEALAQIELAAGLDPLNPAEKLLYSGTLIQAGDFAAALSVAEELVAFDPDDINANQIVEISAYRLGEYDKVIR